MKKRIATAVNLYNVSISFLSEFSPFSAAAESDTGSDQLTPLMRR